MHDPDFIEWLNEGTREEVYEKKRRFIKYLRENPEEYAGDPALLYKLEASINRSEAATNKLNFINLEIAALEYEQNQANRALDETLMTKENLSALPLFVKPKNRSN